MKLKTQDEIFTEMVRQMYTSEPFVDRPLGSLLRTVMVNVGCKTRSDIDNFVAMGMDDDMLLQAKPVAMSDEAFMDEVVWARTRITLGKLDLT